MLINIRELDNNAHSVFLLYYHLILVVKYRKKVLNDPISGRAREIFEYIAPKYHITLEEWNHDEDHVHIMFRAHPKSELSKFINAYKSASSRLIKKEYPEIRQHRKIRKDACLKGASVCLEADGRYYVSLLYFCEEKPVETRNIRQAVGLDFSMKELYVDSNGKHAGYPHYFRNSEEKLAKAQRKLSHCRKGSNRYKKQQKKVARIHTHIAHQRKDYLHKESRKITNFYDIVCIEDLDLKTMSGEHHFGKSVHDNGWRMFTDFLQYKLEREGKKLVRIDRWYPSSRTCSCCGKIKHDLKLEERVYLCSCGNRMDRDENAAANICREGLRISGIILEKSEKAS